MFKATYGERKLFLVQFSAAFVWHYSTLTRHLNIYVYVCLLKSHISCLNLLWDWKCVFYWDAFATRPVKAGGTSLCLLQPVSVINENFSTQSNSSYYVPLGGKGSEIFSSTQACSYCFIFVCNEYCCIHFTWN